MEPPAWPGHMMLVGEDEHGLAAVAWTSEESSPAEVFIRVAAVALRLRHCGGAAADELADEVKDRCASRADAMEWPYLLLTWKVDHRNVASLELSRRIGGEPTDHEDGYELWSRLVVWDSPPDD
jgi:hypothetical protein